MKARPQTTQLTFTPADTGRRRGENRIVLQESLKIPGKHAFKGRIVFAHRGQSLKHLNLCRQGSQTVVRGHFGVTIQAQENAGICWAALNEPATNTNTAITQLGSL
jgi:hypothetical protein